MQAIGRRLTSTVDGDLFVFWDEKLRLLHEGIIEARQFSIYTLLSWHRLEYGL
jgi:hypothetical protein